jgi:hypothetical protein
MKWRTQNICIGVLIAVDTSCGDVSLFALASDVSQRSTACIFTMKEEGTFTLCFVSCASAQLLSGRRVGLSGRGIIALNICTALVVHRSYQIKLTSTKFFAELKRAVPPTDGRPCPPCRYQFALRLCTEDKQACKGPSGNTLISRVKA